MAKCVRAVTGVGRARGGNIGLGLIDISALKTRHGGVEPIQIVNLPNYRPKAPVAVQALLHEAPYFRSPLVCAFLAQANGFERHLAMKNLSYFQLIQLLNNVNLKWRIAHFR